MAAAPLLLLLLLVPVPLLPLLAQGPGGALGNRHAVYWNSSNQQSGPAEMGGGAHRAGRPPPPPPRFLRLCCRCARAPRLPHCGSRGPINRESDVLRSRERRGPGSWGRGRAEPQAPAPPPPGHPAARGLHGAGECERLSGYLLPALQQLRGGPGGGARARRRGGAVRAVYGEPGRLPHLQRHPRLQALGVQPTARSPQPHQVLGEVPALQRLLSGLRVPRGPRVLLHLHAHPQSALEVSEDEGVRLLRLHIALRGEAGPHSPPVHHGPQCEDQRAGSS
ncbi:ephrin-A3 isoform X2 [Balaenoptera musculus]|uniref:Ephrin-A3 isoform X2 n=1 Tax=Balaenoptera musculus TaxID=9771 RepID=A0A8B8VSC9_BALMU|nr:ephrin-A3 isoform X2 [Balaenoptera musculus]